MPNAPVTGWRVESQQETMGRDPKGLATEGIKVFFVTGKGVRSSIFIPKDSYTPANVKAAIAYAAGHLDQVQELSG